MSQTESSEAEERNRPNSKWRKYFPFQAKLRNPHSLEKSSGFFRLLFRTGPNATDILLIVVGTISAIASGIPFPLLGILFGQLLDDVNSASCSSDTDLSGFENGVRTKVLYVIYVGIANFGFIYIYTSCWSLAGERLIRRLRLRYFQALLRQEIAFTESLPQGEVSSRLTADLETIQTGTSEKVGICLASVSYFVAAYIVSFIKAARLAGILISLVPAFLLMALIGGKFIERYAARTTDHIAAATSIASESLVNMKIVHAFGAKSRLETLYAQRLSQGLRDALKKAFASAAQLGTMFFIGYSANALAFWEGSRMIAENVGGNSSNPSVGSIYTVIFLLVDASFIISQIAPLLHIFGSAAGSADKLLDTIGRQSAIDGTTSDQGRTVNNISGDFEFQDVVFSYPSRPDTEVLHAINLRIPAGKHTAIVGLSGSGKSTIAALVERLYDVSGGKILVDGNDIRELNVRQLRSYMGFVQEQPTLLDRSILENIAHGLINSPRESHAHLKPVLMNSSLEDVAKAIRNGVDASTAFAKAGSAVQEVWKLVRQAATMTNAVDFIDNLPHGFATTVGSSGCYLSGGQKQRIAIARALVREPNILILDEATAALDATSERLIQGALDQAAEGRTTLSIAHRLATIKNAHNIIVFERGHVVEQGTHTELLAKDGAYARMVHLQSLARRDSSASSSTTPAHSGEDSTISSKDLVSPADSADFEKNTEGGSPKPKIKEIPSSEQGLATDDDKQSKSFFSTFCVITRPQLALIFLGLAASTITGGAYAGESVIFGHTVGALSTCRAESQIRSSGNLYGLLFFMLAIIELIAYMVNGTAFGWASEKILYRVRVKSLHSLLHQDIQWHESEDRTPSTLLNYLSTDANALASLTGVILGTIFSILVNLVTALILAHAIAWKIAVVLLATMPVVLIAGFLRLRVLAQFKERHQKAFAQSVSITMEAMKANKTIATLSLEQETFQVYRRSLQGPFEAVLKGVAYANFWLASAFSITFFVYALAYWWGAKQVASGLYSSTQFFIVLPLLLGSTQTCGQMFSLAPDAAKAKVSALNVAGLLDIGPKDYEDHSNNTSDPTNRVDDTDIEKTADAQPLATTDEGVSISIRDVEFSYPARPEAQVLRGLSMDILPGQFCALVGPSGSGKSTIIALLEQFYPISAGSITIDGLDISRSDGEILRREMALVPQDCVLFEETIRFNVALGANPRHQVTDTEIEEACRQANIHDTIASLPDGYNTKCGPNGSQFSGGQRQRLAIARALIRKPRLLLLDEPTSALDADSERLLQVTLDKLIASKNVTVVTIAHRLHTIRNADVIFMIEQGRCVDRGTHAELIERSESYRQNSQHQALGD
ncbi:MAG: hypothetical protein M1834_000517 [Cirrosporium novae-zelandiae]|nr:MAG: hypothetical protein M1834_000517 [Cirrosporium novae-zelandiae]